MYILLKNNNNNNDDDDAYAWINESLPNKLERIPSNRYGG